MNGTEYDFRWRYPRGWERIKASLQEWWEYQQWESFFLFLTLTILYVAFLWWKRPFARKKVSMPAKKSEKLILRVKKSITRLWNKDNKLQRTENLICFVVLICALLVIISTFLPWKTYNEGYSKSGWEENEFIHDLRAFSPWEVVTVGVLIIVVIFVFLFSRNILVLLSVVPLWVTVIAGRGKTVGWFIDYHWGIGMGWGLQFILCVSITALVLSLAVLFISIVERGMKRKGHGTLQESYV